MEETKNERRRASRHEVRTRVGLRVKNDEAYEHAHLVNLGHNGLYVITRRKIDIGTEIEIEVPTGTSGDLHIQAEVIRIGHHRYWGLFSYGCRVISLPNV